MSPSKSITCARKCVQAVENTAKYEKLSLLEIRVEDERDSQKPPANLRDLIESDAAWWPEEIVTDGADHFVIPRQPRTRP